MVFVNKGCQFRIIFCCFLCQWMICSYCQVGIIYKGVWVGSVNGQCVVIVVNVEGDFYVFGMIDLVMLYGFNGVWLVIQFIQIVEQFVSVSSDFDKLLWDFFMFNFGIVVLVVVVDNLFVCQYGLVVWVLVDCRSFFIYQVFFIQFGEEFLFLMVVFWCIGCQFVVLVIIKVQYFELVFYICDVVVCLWCWSGVVFYCCVFCRQIKCVLVDWLQDVFVQYVLVVGDYVIDGVVMYVVYVQLIRRIGKYRQVVIFFFVFVFGYFKCVFFILMKLYFGFYFFWVVLFLYGSQWFCF